jgi:diguanylate cyclase (GGDEF)-like protein
VQELSLARDVAGVQRIVRHAARELTGADGATFVLRDSGYCYYADEDAIEPLWKGQRFPMSACISGWSMLNAQSVVIPDIYRDDRIPHDAYRWTFVKSLCMVPIRSADPIGAIGNYWAREHVATDEEMRLLQALADTTAVALVHARAMEDLESVIEERTQQIRRLSITDELTGVLNRRGFLSGAEAVVRHMRRHGGSGHVLFVDIDGLKRVNDELGHEAGDYLIRRAAASVSATVRDTDLVGRWGGDELVVFASGEAHGRLLAERIAQAGRAHSVSLSVGCVEYTGDADRSLDDLINQADADMYLRRSLARQAVGT